MKNLYSLPKTFYCLLLFFAPNSVLLSAQVTESMGTVTGTTSVAAHEAANGFDNDGLTYTATGADVRQTSASTGYTGASGLANVFIDGGESFTIANLGTNACGPVTMTFGIFKSTNASNGSNLVVEYSTDGGTSWTGLSFTALPTGTGTSHWYERTVTGIPAACNLLIRFRNTAAPSGVDHRIDDVRISCGTALSSTCTASITANGPNVFCAGGSIVLTANAGDSYQWSNGATTQAVTTTHSGTYSVTVGQNCCFATSAEFYVHVYNDGTTHPVVEVTAIPCSDGSTVLAVRTIARDLFFSKYEEGLSFDKALEIYNGTGNTVFLGDYAVDLYMNGVCAAPWAHIVLPNVNLPDGQVFTLSHDGHSELGGCFNPDMTSSNLQFNGNDGVVLVNTSTGDFVDIIGSLCHDPGSQWSDTGFYRTKDILLTRRPCVYEGIFVNPHLPGANGFPTLVSEWLRDTVPTACGFGEFEMEVPVEYNISTSLGSDTLVEGPIQADPGDGAWKTQIAIARVRTLLNDTYIVTGTFPNGCQHSAIALPQNCPHALPPVAVSASTASACTGDLVTLTATGAQTYTWLPDYSTGNSITLNVAVTEAFTVVGMDADGCMAAASVEITVHIPPGASVSAIPGIICHGDSTTLQAGGGITWAWQPGNLHGDEVRVAPVTTTTYTVTCTDFFGCHTSLPITVIVNPRPVVSASASPGIICAGDNTTLSATGAYNYVWQPGSLGGSSVTATPLSTTSYVVTGTNFLGCSSTATTAVTVKPVPTVTASAAPPAICVGQNATLAAGGAATYSWQPGNFSSSGPVVSPGSTTVYAVTGTAANGCTNTAGVTVTVYALPVVTASASALSVCAGNSVTLNGGGALSYSWTGASNGVPFVPASTTSYTVTGTDEHGCTGTATIVIPVLPLPTVTAAAQPDTICRGGNSLLTATGASTYEWMPIGHSGSSVAVSPLSTQAYSVTGTDANGCSSSAGTIVAVVPGGAQLSASVSGPPVNLCDGPFCDTIYISISGGTAPFNNNWNGDSAFAVVCPDETTEYILMVVDANQCISETKIMVTVIDSCECYPRYCARLAGNRDTLPPAAGAYPNPFSDVVSIQVHASSTGPGQLLVTDIAGRIVGRLYEGTISEGAQTFTWSPGESGLGSGVYFCEITMNGETQVLKLIYQH